MTSDSVGSGNCWWVGILSAPDRVATAERNRANGEKQQDGGGQDNESFDGIGLQPKD